MNCFHVEYLFSFFLFFMVTMMVMNTLLEEDMKIRNSLYFFQVFT